MAKPDSLPSITMNYRASGESKAVNEYGMRPMQERAFAKRGEQYLLIKSPPASGKSRALMFIALDKLHNQGVKKAVIAVPEKTIGASFHDAPLSQFGPRWERDWCVAPRWNLCDAPGGDNGGKVDAVKAFMESEDRVLVCTHATFRFAVERFGAEAFDGCLLAIDEFHHVSADPDNVLGRHISGLMARGKAHITAMTGSYFRGDAVAVLTPEDETRFETVTYTYYEQLNGYDYLKHLDMGYYFYSGPYADSIRKVLYPDEKTIVHIPSVQARESTKDKIKEAEHILDSLGEWQGRDETTGFQIIKTPEGRILKVADLVDDGPERETVTAALRSPETNKNRDYVDVVIALGMAKEGFDWIWCEHALTIGYRSSLTEIVQIIGRVTRDAEGKTRARFTNLIAEPDASEAAVTDAVNDTLKAVAASLLMEQVLAPKFDFAPKKLPAGADAGAESGPEYNQDEYAAINGLTGLDDSSGRVQIEIKGLVEPKSDEAKRICKEDLNEVLAAVVQDKTLLERGLFDQENTIPEEITQVSFARIVREKYPELDEGDQEAVRQHAVAAMHVTQKTIALINSNPDLREKANTSFIDGVNKFVMDVRGLDIDLIDRVNPFGEAYAVLAKTMREESLKQVAAVIAAKRIKLSIEEAREFTKRAIRFKQERGRLPSLTAADPWEKCMAEGVAFIQSYEARNADE